MLLRDLPLIDWRTFDRTRRLLGHDFQRVFGYLLEDGPRSLTMIERALREKKAAQIVSPAHCIKGEALHFGAAQLALLASTIEFDARDCVERHTDTTPLIADVARLRPLFDQSIAEFERVISSGYDKRRAA
jgi:HPt (histidine-containing phosphotransfer) domain-containing protein